MKHLLTTALLLLTLLSAQATIEVTPLVDCLCESGSSPQQAFELTAEGTAGPFSFEWHREEGDYSPSTEQNPIDIKLPGNYYVLVTNSFGCTFQYDITIPACPAPSFSGDKTETCPGQATGSITVTAAGGTPPYTYSWSNGADTPDIYDLAEGIYYLTLEDSRGCTKTGFFKVLSSGLGFSVNVAITHPSCAASADGALQLAMQPAGTYTIDWSNGGDGESISGLEAGSYTATITDANGCLAEKTMVLLAPAPIEVFAEQVYPATCPEAADGRAVLLVSGGTLPYAISWSNGETGPAAVNLVAGSNPVTVTDGNGCIASTVANIPSSGEGLAVNATITPMSCSNGPDGAISLNVDGASGQLAYSWSGPEGRIPQHNSAHLSGLGLGNYCATVTDGLGCAGSGCWVVEIEETEYPYIREVEVLAVDVSTQQTTTIYKGEWVRTAAGCLKYIKDESVQITAEIFDAIQANEVQINVLATSNVELATIGLSFPNAQLAGGQWSVPNPLTYQFNPGWPSNSIIQNGMVQEELLFTGMDLSNNPLLDLRAYTPNLQGCVELPLMQENCTWPPGILAGGDDVHVLQMPCFDIEIFHDMAQEELSVRIIGEPLPYDDYLIIWTQPDKPGFFAEGRILELEGLVGKKYCVVVRDQSGCTREQCITFCSDLDRVGVDINPTCPGESGGSACLSFYNGFTAEDVQAYWSLNGQLIEGNLLCLNNLPEGDHHISIKIIYLDCETINFTQVIHVPTFSLPPPLEGTPHFLQADCPATPEGEGLGCIAPSGGAPPYAYSWSTGGEGICTEGLIAGETYTVTVSGQCNSAAVFTITMPDIYEPFRVNESSIMTEGSTCTSNTGLAIIPFTGGEGPYEALWISSDGAVSGSTTALSSPVYIEALSAGVYNITVNDGCGATEIFNITIPDISEPLEVNEGGLITEGAICVSTTGSAVIPFAGGEGPYDASWVSSGGTVSGSTTILSSPVYIEELGSGDYDITIIDVCGQSANFTINISQVNGPASFQIIESTLTHLCEEGSSGTIDITVGGEQEAGPFTYAWSTGASTEDVENLVAGVYAVTVTDKYGCEINSSFEIALFQPMLTEKITHACGEGSDGEISITFMDESGINTGSPYTFTWNDGTVWEAQSGFFNNSLTALPAGNYSLTLANSWGCERAYLFEVESLAAPEITLANFQGATMHPLFPNQDLGDGFLEIEISNSSDYSILWSNGVSTALNEELSSGSYSVTVTDLLTSCYLSTGFIVTACPFSSEGPLQVNAPVGSIVPDLTSTGGAISIEVTGGYPPYSFNWSGPDAYSSTNQNITHLEAGEYCVVVEDHCGRQEAKCFTIKDSCPDFTIDLGHINQCDSENGQKRLSFDHRIYYYPGSETNVEFTIEWTGPGLSSPIMGAFRWNPYQFLSGAQYIDIPDGFYGTYNCKVTDQYGCSQTAWMQFLPDEANTFYATSERRFGSSNFWNVGFEEFQQAEILHSTYLPAPSHEELFNSNYIVRLCQEKNCGCQFDGQLLYCSSRATRCLDPFCFIPDNAEISSDEECYSGGVIHLPGWGFFDVPAGYGWKITLDNKCGCIFPMEAFENVGSPVAYSWGNDAYGPIHHNTNYFIFAECGTCSENFDEDNEVPIDDTEQCIFQDDVLGECFLVTYSSESEGSICVIQGFELLNAESCAEAEANGIPYCEEGCPADLIQPFWCINDGYCTTGFFSNTSNTDVLMNEDDVLYLQYNYSNFTNCYLVEENNGAETIPESWLCPDCFVDENAIDIPGCSDEGCGCSVLLTCGTEELLVEGAIIIEHENGQDQQYACPELCHEGHYCIKRKKCDLGASYGAYLIEESIFTETSFITQECTPDGLPNPVEGSCIYRYYCDDELTHTFCLEDCNSNAYECNSNDITPCAPGVIPLVARPESERFVKEDGFIQRYSFEIVEENSFAVSEVFPNPFRAELNIKLTASYEGKAYISLINLLGQEVLRNQTRFIRGFNPIVLNTNSRLLENGLYHLLIRDEKGNSFLTKVVFNK